MSAFSPNARWQPPLPIPSPCIKVCEMDAQTQLCKGCYRSIEEISYWSTMGNAARERAMREIETRKQAQFL